MVLGRVGMESRLSAGSYIREDGLVEWWSGLVWALSWGRLHDGVAFSMGFGGVVVKLVKGGTRPPPLRKHPQCAGTLGVPSHISPLAQFLCIFPLFFSIGSRTPKGGD